jgi:hypothetical protein
MSTDCGTSFVTNGGMRLLKRWIKIAEEENYIDELTKVMTTLMKLPFNEKVVKDTEIGKAIKKLLKLKGTPENTSGVAKLHKEVKALMEHWTNQVQQKPGPTSPKTVTAEPPALDENTKQFLQQVSKVVKKTEVVIPSASTPRETPREPASPTASNHKQMTFEEKKAASVDLIGSLLGPTVQDKPETKSPVQPSALPANSLAAKLASAQQNLAKSAAASASAAPTTAASSTSKLSSLQRPHRDRERKLENMAEGAKKYLSSRPDVTSAMDDASNLLPFLDDDNNGPYTSASIKSTAGFSSAKTPATILSAGAVAAHATAATPALRSALKRKSQDAVDSAMNTTDSTDASGSVGGGADVGADGNLPKPKRAKMSVKWVDQCNAGPLRQVFSFEVEKIKNSVASYKNYKDLVKKEKQLEKDTIVHKVTTCHIHFVCRGIFDRC